MGIVLWEVLARQRLMTGESAANTLHKLMNEPIPRLSTALPTIDPVLEAIVMRALEKDPQLRFQSAAEMRDGLEDWLRGNPRQTRQEDVSRKMLGLFGSVREEVQRQVQKHMTAITAATNTQELQALSAESLLHMEQSGANVSGQLLRLNGSGSGSGVIPNYGMGSQPVNYPRGASGTHSQSRAGPPVAETANENRPGNNTLLIVIAIGFFLLAGLLIIVLGLRDRRKGDPVAIEGPVTTASATPTISATSVPVASESAPAVVAESTAAPPATGAVTAAPIATTKGIRPSTGGSQRGTTGARVQPPPPPPVEERENGFLTINVYPWAKVTEGGRVLCAATPCNKIPLAPGAHTLQLENAEQGMKQSTTVTIKSGETTARAIGFK